VQQHWSDGVIPSVVANLMCVTCHCHGGTTIQAFFLLTELYEGQRMNILAFHCCGLGLLMSPRKGIKKKK